MRVSGAGALAAAIALFAMVAHATVFRGGTRWVFAANVPKRRDVSGRKTSSTSSKRRAPPPRRRPPPPPPPEDFYSDEESGFDDEYDDDFEDAYYAPPPPPPKRRSPPPKKGRSSVKGRGGRRGSSSRSSGGMVPYGYGRRPPPGPSTMEKLLIKGKEMTAAAAASAAAAADVASKRGAEAARAAQRAAKAKTSSDFEKLLMRATSPTDSPVTRPDMDLVFYEIKSFQRKARRKGVQNPYEKCLHKLWTKMTDPDWRTTAKAVGVLHRISRDAKPQDRALFATHVAKLKKSRRTKSSKKSKVMAWRYLSERAVADSLGPAGEPYADFVQNYFAFVAKRLDSFTGRFDELQLASFEPAEARVEAKPVAAGGSKKSKKRGGKGQARGGSRAAAAAPPVEVVAKGAACVSPSAVEAAKELVELALAVECIGPPSGGGRSRKGKGRAAAAARSSGRGGGRRGGASSRYDEDEDDEEDEEDSAGGVAVPNIVACDAQSLMADDLEALWRALSLMLKAALLGGEDIGLDEEQVDELKEWWVATLPKVAAWRAQYKASMWAALKLKASPPSVERWLTKAQVLGGNGGNVNGGGGGGESRASGSGAAPVESASGGGAPAPQAGTTKKEPDEEVEEEDDDEEDDEDEEEEDEYDDDF